MKLFLCASLILVGIASSGCVAGGASQAQTTDGNPPGVPDAAEPPKFDDNTGAIIGTVTDDEVQPIPGASVGVLGPGGVVTTADVNGAYTLSNLPPGPIQLSAQALGFETEGKAVTVIAGEAVTANFALVKMPILEAYSEVKHFTGYISCAFAVVRTTLPVSCNPNEALVNYHEPYKAG